MSFTAPQLGLFCALIAGGLCAVGCKEGDVDLDWGDGGETLREDGGRPDGGGQAGASGSGSKPDAGGDPDDDAGEPVDSGPQPDAQVDQESPAAWPTHLARAICDALESCYGSAELLLDALSGRDCVSLNEGDLSDGELHFLPDSVANGTVLYRSEDLQDCLADVRSLGCDVRSRRLPASCELVVVGTIALGDECSIDEECEGAAFCDKGPGASCPSVCRVRVAEDGICRGSDDDQCADGLVCPGGADFTSTCVAYGELDDPCGAGENACKPGLVCSDLETTGQPTCASLDTVFIGELGDACSPTGGKLCANDLVCESVSASEGKCAERVDAGEPCKRAQPNQCPVDQYCSATGPGISGTCTDLPGDGETCLASRSPACADGHICITGENLCRPRKQLGEACETNPQCYSGRCDSDNRCATAITCASP